MSANVLQDIVDERLRRLERTFRDSECAQEEGRSSPHIEAERTALEAREREKRVELAKQAREAESKSEVAVGAVIDYLTAVGISRPDEVFLALRAALDAAEN